MLHYRLKRVEQWQSKVDPFVLNHRLHNGKPEALICENRCHSFAYYKNSKGLDITPNSKAFIFNSPPSLVQEVPHHSLRPTAADDSFNVFPFIHVPADHLFCKLQRRRRDEGSSGAKRTRDKSVVDTRDGDKNRKCAKTPSFFFFFLFVFLSTSYSFAVWAAHRELLLPLLGFRIAAFYSFIQFQSARHNSQPSCLDVAVSQ